MNLAGNKMITISNAQTIGKRKKQEDYFAWRAFNGGYICIVADGIGGESGGERASRISVKSFLKYLHENKDEKNYKKLFLNALYSANDKIKVHKKENPRLKHMGTTFTALYVDEEKAFWISVGDGIIYLLRGGVLRRLNEEHLEVGEINQMLLNGEISQANFNNYPDKNIITSALLGEKIEHIDVGSGFFNVENGDMFLVASDGLHTLSVKSLVKMCEGKSGKNLANGIIQMVEQINKTYQDNATLITIKTVKQEDKMQKRNFFNFSNLTKIKSKIVKSVNHANP